MRLLSFEHDGHSSFGVATDAGVFDLGRRLDGRFASLRQFIAAGDVSLAERHALGNPDYAFESIAFLPVIPDPDKIFCIGLNYRDHAAEVGRSPTEKPVIFLRLAASQVGHLQSLVAPRASADFDYEGEMAAIIGRGGRHITAADALGHVAGYACYNDGSLRDWQRHTSQWTPGKNFFATGGFGPWMVTADEIGDPSRLDLVTRLNGLEMQRSNTSLMIFAIAEQIAYISSFIPLAPGDVIVTGTPGGVGFKRNPPAFMRPGDTVSVEIERVGTLTNTVAAEA